LRRWRNLCVAVAAAHGAAIDTNVFDLPRVLRIPGSRSYKYDPPVLVEAHSDTGAPMSLDELEERLDEAGFLDDRNHVGGTTVGGVDVLAAVQEWAYAGHSCDYMSAAVDGWASDPISGRHGWLFDKAIKLASAHRNGCLTRELHRRGIDTLASRLREERAADGSDRHNRGEFARTMRDAIVRVAAFPDEKIVDEVNHLHDLVSRTASAGSVSETAGLSEAADTRSSEVCTTADTFGQPSDQVSETTPGVGPLTSHSDGPAASDAAPAVDPLAAMVSADWLGKQTFPPLEYVVPGLITEGCGMISGAPKIGKSWFVAALALAVALGLLALGRIKVDSRPVLYLALEDGHRRLQSRFRAILGPDVALPHQLYVVTRADSADQARAMIAEFLRRQHGRKPLIVLDTLGKVKPPRRAGEDAYQADYAAMSQLKALVDDHPGSTLLLVHHTRKAEADDFVSASSGTYGIAGAVDFTCLLTRKRHSPEAQLTVTGRDINEGRYALTNMGGDDGIVWHLDGDDLASASACVAQREEAGEVAALGDRSQSVLLYVRNSDVDVTPKSVADALDIDNDQSGKYLRRLADKGLITPASRGKYRRLGLPVCKECGDPMTAGQTDTHLSCRASAA
jgi:hypothetical protein